VLRFLIELFDGATMRRLGLRVGLGIAAIVVLLIGLVFLLVAAEQAVAAAIGPVYAPLVFAAACLLLAAVLYGIGAYAWRSRPRPLAAAARAGVLREGLSVLAALLRREPARLVFAGLVLGALAEYLQKREDKSDENS
jgi:hypothetical protein